ncbi:phospholipase D-like domain-containing protein [Methylobacterium platani]|uniref:Phospholipase D n=2 Tax=Methylobacterium platani TaxID=427683 RepID=A0A179SIA9_9HYPH|nr:phospholipase D-like domain-containing protein [Methylobacterium platani]KMO10321.1 phospholipase [Methylobacterium platani JCM 14648]OAS27295.1 phospholipase [Methylobacterium platani]
MTTQPACDETETLFQPGRTCWCVARAERVAVMIDSAEYFARLEDALRQAQTSILIVGWDFDGRIRLRHDASAEESPPLGPLLRDLAARRPGLEVRVLVWSVATVHGPGAALPLLFGAEWEAHPRISVRLDTHHPLYAAHHQKLVCIDDRVAFAGGIDLTVGRWDTPAHTAGDPLRTNPDGELYPPVHDLQMAVDGEAAARIGDLARARWRAATGEILAPVAGAAPVWPQGLAPLFTDAPVAIARTMPLQGREPSVEEAAALTAAALASARETIYLEAQYLTADFVADALAAHLAAEAGPEIVVVLTRRSHNFTERVAMGTPRDRVLRRLRAVDRFGRLLVAYPVVPGSGGEDEEEDCEIEVHAKLVLIDDRFLRIGSSNLNNRSVALDTECDLAVEARTPEERRAIRSLRDRLLAEHLGLAPEAMAEATSQDGLIAAIRRHMGGPRSLRVCEVPEEEGLLDPLVSSELLDPERPFGTA